MNSILSSDNKNKTLDKKTMTTKELAEILGVSTDSVQNTIKKLGDNFRRDIKTNNQGGYLINESQATAIKLELQNHSKVNFNTPTTSIERALFIQKAMQMQNDIINELQSKITELTPKAEFFDAVADSKTAISIAEVAKVLHFQKIGQNKLFEILRAENILMGNNQPYQRFIDAGYFRLIESKFVTAFGETRIYFKTLVFQKGVNYIRKILITKGYVDISKEPEYMNHAINAIAGKVADNVCHVPSVKE